MRIMRSAAGMQRQALRWRREGRRVGFVPTMGYLHEGHLSLVRAARRRVGKTGVVVLSIFVNPTQFGRGEDLSRYPRDWRRDCRLCRAAGVDVVFVPSETSMYPGGVNGAAGGYSTYVNEEVLSRGLEGVSRPTHFRGVTTVVAKLLNLVLPDVAVFGAKDYQQAAVVRRMVRDLNLPVRLVVSPTCREADGLAMSSRNTYLGPEERRQAVALVEAIREARRAVRASGGSVAAAPLLAQLRRRIESRPAARVDYLAVVDPDTLEPLNRAAAGAHLVLAVWVGRTRLIDNGRL